MRRKQAAAAIIFAVASLGFAPAPSAAPAEPPTLDLVMTPHATAGLDVSMTLAPPALKAGDPLVHLPLKLVGIPTARYDGDALTARDDAGPLPLVQAEEPPTPQGIYRRWSVTRSTVGPVIVHYRAPPREITAATNNGPLFDLRAEGGGFIGAGVGFVATPVRAGPYRVKMHWDLAHAPPGSFGTWSFGEGDVDQVLTADQLAFSYYAVGPLKRYPAPARDHFALYWLSPPPFDPAALGERIHKLYAFMADFFGDSDSSYRVFMRQNPYKGLGGTALAHSFMFGYEAAARPTVDSLQNHISHEMTHNWPSLQGEHGDIAWYTEGTAEYYSLLLSYRAGALTTARYLDSLNERAIGYYSNPYRALSNPEAARIFWSDAIAQTVPYGRGFLYLMRTDAQIRGASQGAHSLDDVVKALRKRQVAGQPYGVPEWLALVGAEIGPERAKREYDAMTSGALLVPPADRYSPCFAMEQTTTRPFELGFARASLNDDRVVRGLQPESAAARAGLRDGDVIVAVGDLEKVRADAAQPLTLKVRRAGAELEIAYTPRGAQVPAWRWTRNAATPDAACRF